MTKKELFWDKVSKMTKKEMIELIIKCVDYNDGKLSNEFDRQSVWKSWMGEYRTNCHGRNGALLTSLTKWELQDIAEKCTRFITCLSLV